VSHGGFTLVELLVVVGVIVLMMGLAIPAFNAIRGNTDFASSVYSVSGALQEARAYAMGNNTYVLVGFEEVSANQNPLASPQVSGTGRLAIAIVASRDGTRPYQSLLNAGQLTGQSYLASGYGSGTQYAAVNKLLVLPNVHMIDLQSSGMTEPTGGGMVRPWQWTNWEYYCLGNTAQCTAANCFMWPLGASASGNPTPQYIFYQVIEFDPQGTARIILANPSQANVSQTAIPYTIEIGLEPTNGIAAPTPPATEQANGTSAPGQIVAVQVDGMTGAVRTYRP
jgi:prepilin-type N-terminal cleavage/methylation domain-containing protein